VTPAVRQLEGAGVALEIAEYDHDPDHVSYGTEAAEALGVDGSRVFKTLVVTVDNGELVVGVIPVVCLLDLKAVARAASAKKATMAEIAIAERRTGYVAGGISPFGQRNRHRTFVDESAELWDTVYVSGGRRGLEVVVPPAAFVELLQATFCDLTAGAGRS